MSGQVTAPRIVIAGGGTGGHIYPGLAIALALKEKGAQVTWVGARGGLEEKLVPKAGFPLELIPIGKLHHSVGKWQQIKTLLGMPLALIKTVYLYFKLKPDIALGVGGYASGPILAVTRLFGHQIMIWEPNAHAGLANRILAGFAKKSLVVFESAFQKKSQLNIEKVGLPVRVEIERLALSNRAPMERDFKKDPLRVLVFGGSQGARAINQALQDFLLASEQGRGLWEQTIWVHQTGVVDFKKVYERYQSSANSGLQLECVEYLNDMSERYRWADLVICRSGASTVAEIAAARKAAIFIPLPTAADNHQLKNAQALVSAKAAGLIEQKDLRPEIIARVINQVLENPSQLAKWSEAAGQFAVPQAAQKVAQIVLETL